MDDIIKEIRNEFNRIEDSRQEGNLQLHVIINTFVKFSGYDIKKCEVDKPIAKGFSDIYIPTIGKEALIIEVKNGKGALKIEDISQALRYATHRQQRFAILTNGKEYVLLDRFINSEPKKDDKALKS